jgi:hypothetical protein
VSFHYAPSQAPGFGPRPPSDPRFAGPSAPRRGAARPGRPTRMPRWGWVEWVIFLQIALPALMFVPGLAKVRIVTRVAAFAIPLLAWGAVAASGRRSPAAGTFAPAAWLAGASVWLVLSILHPFTNSLASGAAQAALCISILSPALWAPQAMGSPRQVSRLMAILLVCNGASALVGVGQFYRPDRFNPPVIAQVGPHGVETLMYETADGRKILRPCGLTDTPGGACAAGMLACIAGLGFAMSPIALWRRLASLGLAAVGMAAIYFSQVRSTLLLTAAAILALLGLLVARRDFRKVFLLTVAGGAVIIGTFVWVARKEGAAVLGRFETLLEGDFTNTYYRNRGFFVEDVYKVYMWRYPLGAGMGRWGQMYAYFGDRSKEMLWAEVQWAGWVFDGGIPLLLIYSAAIVLAIWDSTRIALTSRAPQVGYWAAVVTALNLSTVLMTFSYVPFIGPPGIQFWALAGALHAADRYTRLAKRPGRAAPGRPPAPAFGRAM